MPRSAPDAASAPSSVRTAYSPSATDKRAYIADRGACMECGACALNCAWDAISVKPGVGCAEAIIHSWIYGGEPTCGCATPGPASGASAGSACCGGGPVLPRELSSNESCADSAPSAGGCGCGSAAVPADAGKPQAPA